MSKMAYINPAMDKVAITRQLALSGRVLVRDFFTPQVAQALFDALQDVDWDLSYRNQDGDVLLTGDQLRQLDLPGRDALALQIVQVAERNFQFSFFSHSLVHAALAGRTDLLARFVRWMADEEFLGYMRKLTGQAELNRLYAQATMYRAGSFLRVHDDQVPTEDRRVAYVINLTRDWRPDWGGLLHFCDDKLEVVDTFVPHYNSMSIFLVPQNHFVSQVAPFATGQRCAITGWLIRTQPDQDQPRQA